MLCVFVSNWLVPYMQITLLSHIENIFVFFLFLIWKTKCLNSLKIMKKSPITEHSDLIIGEKKAHQDGVIHASSLE